MVKGSRVVGYARVSTLEQAESQLGVEAQRADIEAECIRRGWDLVDVIVDAGYSGKNANRPGLRKARTMLKKGDVDGLVVSKLDRLTRSMFDFSDLLESAQREQWSFVALDLGVDTTTAAGELVANVMASVAQWERRAIGERTRDALAAKKAQGFTLGRPRLLPDDVVRRIHRERRLGRSLRSIAEGLNVDAVATAQGGRQWYASTVAKVLRAEDV